jgi:hypothetical protein
LTAIIVTSSGRRSCEDLPNLTSGAIGVGEHEMQ